MTDRFKSFWEDEQCTKLMYSEQGCQPHGGHKLQRLHFSHCSQGMPRSQGKVPKDLLQSGQLLQTLPRPLPWLPEETLELLTRGNAMGAAFGSVNFPRYFCCNHFPSFQLLQLLLKEHKALATIDYLLSNSNNNSTFSAMVRGKKTQQNNLTTQLLERHSFA